MQAIADFKHPNVTMEAICEAWPTEFEDTLTEDRYDRYVLFLTGFCSHYGPTRMARAVTPSHVHKWVNSKKWSVSRKRDGGQAVKRVSVWAVTNGWIPTSSASLEPVVLFLGSTRV